MPRTVDPEQLAAAKRLRDDGATWNAVHEQTGLSLPTLFKYLGPNAGKDATPGGRKGSVKPRKPAPTNEQLQNLFSKVASAPAIPMILWVHCDFCANHFASTGPDAATKLVELSQDHPALRNLMEVAWRYADEMAWAGVLTTWAGIPIAHHLAPEFIYRYFVMMNVLPPKGASTVGGNGHVHSPPAPGSAPFEGMDTESLLRMAENFGIKIELPNMNGDDATTATESTESADESEQAAQTDATDEAAPAATDSDTIE